MWSQRGGHGGGGGHAGFSGGHSGGFAGHAGGHIGGGRSFSGMHSGGMRSASAASRGFNHSFNRNFANGSFRNRGFRDHRFHNFGFRNNCNGFGCRNWGWNGGWGWGSPWWGWNSYDPWIWSTWDDEDRRFDEDYYGQYEMADEWNRQNLEEIRMMREEQEDGDQDAYAPRSYDRRPASGNEAQAQPVFPRPCLCSVISTRKRSAITRSLGKRCGIVQPSARRKFHCPIWTWRPLKRLMTIVA